MSRHALERWQWLVCLLAVVGLGCDPQDPDGADLVATWLSTPRVLRGGEELTVSWEICNRGGAPSPAGAALVGLVPEGGSPAESVSVESWLPALPTGSCIRGSETFLDSSLAGRPWTPFILADPLFQLAEHSESDNARTDDPVSVSSVDVRLDHPRVVGPGESLALEHEACSGISGATFFGMLISLSQDAQDDEPAGSVPDFVIGNVGLGDAPGECRVVTTDLALPVGTGHDGAFARLVARYEYYDLYRGEFEERRVAGPSFFFGSAPDLAIEGVEVHDPLSEAGGLGFGVTLCNRGNVLPAEATQVGIFADHAQPSRRLATASFEALVPGTCAYRRIAADAPLPAEPGPWTAHAAIDAASSPSDPIRENDALDGALLHAQPRPDLVVRRIVAPPRLHWTGSRAIAALICNEGNAASGGFAVDFYVGDQGAEPGPARLGSHPFGGDVRIATDPYLPTLDPGRCLDSIGFAWLSSEEIIEEGTLFVSIEVDGPGSIQESDATNNVASQPISFSTELDPVVTRIEGPPSARLGEPMLVRTQVCNTGISGPFFGAPISLHLLPEPEDRLFVGLFSARPDQTPTEFQNGSSLAGHIEPLECGFSFFDVAWDGPTGEGWLAADLPDIPLGDPRNDRLVGPVIGIGDGPDLVPTALRGPVAATPSELIDVELDVCNRGTDPSTAATARLYLSEDGRLTSTRDVIEGPDALLADLVVPAIAAGGCDTVSAQVEVAPRWPSDAIAFRLAVIVDELDQLAELVESNNELMGPEFGLGVGPELIARVIDAPRLGSPGSDEPVEIEVCNVGSLDAPASMAQIQSMETERFAAWESLPRHVTWLPVDVPPLVADSCFQASVPFPLTPAVLNHRIDVLADGRDEVPELLEENNRGVGPRVIVGDGADFVVELLSATESFGVGDFVSAEARVCNRGNEPSTAATLRLLLSLDDEVEFLSPDQNLAEAPIEGLAVDACADVVFDAEVTSYFGPWRPRYLGIALDELPVDLEPVESNQAVIAIDWIE